MESVSDGVCMKYVSGKVESVSNVKCVSDVECVSVNRKVCPMMRRVCWM